jgi:hypothetical protein
MWMNVLAATLLSIVPGQTGKLSVTNERLTYGHLGPARTDGKYLPGDGIHLLFEVQNITFDANGKASYALGLELTDPKGGEVLNQKPRPSTAMNYLGGSTLPCAVQFAIPVETAPGTYTLRATVIDKATSQSVTVQRKIEVLPKGFGLIQVGTTADREGNMAWSPVGVVGDSIYLNFTAVGFTRDSKTKQPHVKVEMRALDEKGQPVKGAKMFGSANADVPESLLAIPMQFGITLNREGRFTLEVTATDALSGKTAKVLFPVKITTP